MIEVFELILKVFLEVQMFKIAVITDQISMNLEESFKAVKELGLKYVEIHALWDKNIEDLNKEEVKKVKSLLKNYDLSLSNISSTIFLQCSVKDKFIDFPNIADWFLTISGDFEKHLEALRKSIVLCNELETDKIRIFGFRKEDIEEDKLIEIISEKIGKAVEIAEKANVTLILENCPFTYLPAGIYVKKVVESLGSNYLKSLWDPGNTLRSGKIRVYPEDYNSIKNMISHIHLKDVNSSENSGSCYNGETMVSLGEGMVGYKNILKNLIEDEYNGVISLEPEYTLDIDNIEGRINAIKESLNFIYNN